MITRDLGWFLLLSAINIALLAWCVRRWSVFSAEGLCFFYVGMAVVTDNIHLLVAAFWFPDTLRTGPDEFTMRLYPTLVHIVGLASLSLGLFVSNPKPKSVAVELEGDEPQLLFRIGLGMAIAGAVLYGIALVLVGALSAGSFYATLDTFRSEELAFGGFWYRGLDLMILGFGSMLASIQRSILARAGAFLGMVFVSVALTSNKGGLERVSVWALFFLFIYNKGLFRRILRPQWLVLALIAVIAVAGAKNMMMKEQVGAEAMTATSVIDAGVNAVAGRYSDEGLYRGYCSLLNYIEAFGLDGYEHNAGEYTLTSWVPRLINPFKEDNPFRRTGHMINPLGKAASDREVAAPTLVGWAYWDTKIFSVIFYLFLGGVALGLMRRFMASPKAGIYKHLTYVCFALLGGISSESGFLGAPYTLILASGAVLAPWAMLKVYEMQRDRRREPGQLRLPSYEWR